MVLYVNSCVRDESRTDIVARAVLGQLGGEYTELFLPDEDLKPMSQETLHKRESLIAGSDYSDPMFRYAKQFAEADRIVIAAPFWDLSFPALLKLYIENIYVPGIVSRYDDEGRPHGLCKAEQLVYVTTAGGEYVPDYSFEYIKALSEQYFGIADTVLVKADMLDIEGNDVLGIVSNTVSGNAEWRSSIKPVI